jgi:hypothetical protein
MYVYYLFILPRKYMNIAIQYNELQPVVIFVERTRKLGVPCMQMMYEQ